MIYILSCDTIQNGGGIYGYNLTENGNLERVKYFACDRPMYAVKCKKGLCVLLRKPFENSDFSGYFYIDDKLQTATQIKSTKGVVGCHLCVNDEDVYIVNYLSGNVVKNGEIVAQRVGKGAHLTRQTQSHTHFVDKTPDGYFAVCDLGTDSLAFYDKDLTLISEEKVPSGYGIRHLVFSKDGKYIYAVNELAPSVSVFLYEGAKAKLLNTVKIDCKNKKASGAAIRLSNDGQKLYVSLREENVICEFLVDNEKLTYKKTVDCGGDSPRDFNIFNDYLICANEKSNSVTVLSLKNQLEKQKTKLLLSAVLCVL